MGRKSFTSLTEKVSRILSVDEAKEEFPLLRDVIMQTPPEMVYLMVTEKRPTHRPIPPQMIGPYPNRESAEEAIRKQEEDCRASLQYAKTNLVHLEKITKLGGDEDV